LRARRRAVLAALGLLAIGLGMPVVLALAIGNPLPAAIPSPVAIRLAIESGNLEARSVAKGLALLLWACWAYFALTGVAAGIDALRHRAQPALRLPSPSVRLVAILAGAIWMSSAPLRLAGATTLPAPTPLHLAAHREAAPAPVQTAPRPAPPTPALRRTYLVRPRDTLWGIATRELGEGARWREIFELNRNRVMANGVVFTDPSLIEPGWVLDLPAAPAAPSHAPRPSPTPPPPPEPARPARDSKAAPTARPEAAPARSADDLARHASPPLPTTGAAEHSTIPGSTAARGVRGAPGEDRELLLGAGALLVGAAVAYLGHRRRLQARLRRRGTALPHPARATTERLAPLLAAADLDATLALDVAIRVLGVELHAAHRSDELLGVAAVRVFPDAIEVDKGGPGEPTASFARSARGWRIEREALRAHAAISACTPLPCLVTLAEGDEAELVNLEAFGALALDGPPDLLEKALRAAATEFVTAPWTERAWLVLFGVATELAPLEHVRFVEDPEAELRLLERYRSEAIEIGLRHPNPYENRIAGNGAEVVARLVVVGPAVDEATCRRLVELAGVGAVVLGGANLPARHRRSIGGDRAHSATPPQLERETLLAFAEAVEVASSTEAEPVRRTAFAPNPATAARPAAISILGTPALRGPERVRGAVVELLAYLALHRDEAPFRRDELARRLGSGAGSTQKTIQNRLSEALAVHVKGAPAIERSGDDRLSLRADVTTDWERFQALGATGELDAFAEAIALVRGSPLAGWEDRSWVAEELLVYDIERIALDLLLDAGDAFLLADRPEDAERAARQGLLLSPGHEKCRQLLLRAASALDGRGRLDETMRFLAAHVREASDGDEELSGECWTLYRKLGGKPASHVAE